MGFGKWVLGGVCAVGAVIAAPVVLPMAAAGAAAAGAAAATAGAAVAGAAATAGAAVAGAATTVGAAVASSAVGTAVAGAAGAVASSAVGTAVAGGMAAVGTTVGAAASAVGTATGVAAISGIATASATAVGTIATAGAVGVAATGVGAKKMLEAKDIVDNAEGKYNKKKNVLDKEEKETNEALNYLGQLKIQVWNDFKEFYDVITRIKNCNITDVDAKDESLRLSKEELDKLQAISFKASELLTASAGSVAAGVVAGLAAYGGTMAVGTASTGASIAGLTGIAATKATLASLGGGSLAAGGLGVAGGTAVLSGLVAAPALAIGGIFLAFKGNSSVEKAMEVEEKVNDAIRQMNESIKLIKDIKDAVNKVYAEIYRLNGNFQKTLKELKNIVDNKEDFRLFTAEEVKVTERCVLTFKVLKELTTTDLLIKKGDNQKINSKEIENVMLKASTL